MNSLNSVIPILNAAKPRLTYGYSGPSWVSYRVLWGKIRARHFKGKQGKLYIFGSLINVDFGKKYELLVSSILQKKIA